MRRCGFTLLEALAAVITLGLLATAVVPMLRQLARLDLAERIQAQGLLRAQSTSIDLTAGTAQAIAGHPTWRLVVSDLIAGPEPAPPSGSPPPAAPPHHWLRLAILATDSGDLLAETVVAVIDQAAPR